jgi:hypothetical protein
VHLGLAFIQPPRYFLSLTASAKASRAGVWSPYTEYAQP